MNVSSSGRSYVAIVDSVGNVQLPDRPNPATLQVTPSSLKEKMRREQIPVPRDSYLKSIYSLWRVILVLSHDHTGY